MRPQLILAGMLALLWIREAEGHPDRVERNLLTHFATGTHKPLEGYWEDLTHRVKGRIVGAPVYTSMGSAQALIFSGADYLELGASMESARAVLPTREFSVSAWVLLNESTRYGGITGLLQDNGNYEKGWLLGYNNKTFTFTLSTQGADDGDGKLTELRGSKEFKLGEWHQVTATYDGRTMRLYVDGKLDKESNEQSGDILYPDRGRYVLGAYLDDDELYPMEGAIYEVKTYARVLGAEEIEAGVERNKGLYEIRSPINTVLQFVVKPYLQMGTTNGMRILCETTAPSLMTVEYGRRQPLTNQVRSREQKLISEVRLEGLELFTTYFYRVICVDEEGNMARSDVFSFQTAPSEEMGWAFGILGDTQRNPEVTRRCAEGIFALRPNFMLHCGDVVDDVFAKHQWVNDFFEPCSKLFSYVPTFPVIGNHEKNSHWYYDYFSLPEPEYFYTFRYANAEFFMIDSNKNCGPESEQYQRLEKALAASTATWKFAAHHHPCFSSDEDDYGDHWKGKSKGEFTWGDSNVKGLIPLYEKYGVDIVFSGHVHSYERTWPLLQMSINREKGVRYLVSGGGGGGLEQAGPQRSWFTVQVQRGHHYCFAAVQGRTLEFKAYDLEGRLFDLFELRK
jgi:acid phosphatase type 7